MFMKPLWNYAFLSAVFLLAACTQYSDGGLVGDYQSSSLCPASGCADATASENYLSLTSNTSSVNITTNSSGVSNPVTIGGDCYASLYPSNSITGSVVIQTSNAPVTASILSNSAATTTPTCHNGRWEVSIDTRNIPAGNVYTVKLQLIAYDAAGASHVNTASAVKTVTLRK